jgi:hypothetical protein
MLTAHGRCIDLRHVSVGSDNDGSGCRAWSPGGAVRGARVRVADVLSLLASGASEAEILDDYPYLESDDIKACLEGAAAQAGHAVLVR